MTPAIEEIHGFNYQPSYAYTGADIWRRFDAAAFDRELGLGKKHFPKMNGVRLWLAWEVFAAGSEKQREQFLQNVDTTFGLAAKHGLAVMPVLFNRWHLALPEWGGVFLDHLIHDWFPGYCDEYVDAVMSAFATDPRVFAWDLCNEPLALGLPGDSKQPEICRKEKVWLEHLYARCKERGAIAPVTVGFAGQTKHLKPMQHISDILNFHAYWQGDPAKKDDYRRELDACVELSEQIGKPLICSETCWGSFDNAKRVEIVEFSLEELNKRHIGWLVYALHHSLIADLHWPEYGKAGVAGTLHCIEPDGSLRPGHDIINRYLAQ